MSSERNDITLASLQDIGYLSFKDSQFIEDISLDISHFQEAGNSFRVLLFPPFISYNRLLIHKVVEAHFPNLITFSVGDQYKRRTVVAFIEACYRSEKGIQLLSRPKEATIKEQRSSRWRTLSSQERVANWVKLREIKNRKREIWNSPKVFEAKNEEQDDPILSKEDSTNDEMDRTKPKKQAAAIYVPPSLRSKKGAEEQEETVENRSSNTSLFVASENTSCSLAPSHNAEDEPKKPRGRGRGRRKPEIQVYVPRARRVSKPESSKEELSGLSQLETDTCCVENDSKADAEDEEVEIILEQSDKISQNSEPDDISQLPYTYPDDNHILSAESNFPSVDTGGLMSMDSSNCNKVTEEQMNDSLTFEFYDPAVIAFMPCPKQPSTETIDISDGNIGNRLQSDNLCDGDLLQSNEINNSNSEKVQRELIEDSVIHPMEVKEREENMSGITGRNLDSTSSEVKSMVGNNQDVSTTCNSVSHISNSKEENDSTSLDNDKSQRKLKKTKKKKEKESSSNSQSKTVKATKLKEGKPKSSLDEDEDRPKKPLQCEDDEDNGDSWDALFDDDGDCLDDSVLADITATVGKVEIDKPKIDYWSYTPKETDVNFEAFNHIVEIYHFPPEFGTHDIIGAFKDFVPQGFDIKWVDDTHALGVFSSAIAANEALKIFHPMLKIRPMSEASKQGVTKAKSCQEFLQPYKARPETTSMAARRLVAGALGMNTRVPKEVREQERNKLKAAKEKRKQEKQQKVDIWDGNFGKCAMDSVE